MELSKLNIVEVNNGLKNKEFSCVEITQSCLNKINERQQNINAFITITKDLAIQQAKLVDEKISKGEDLKLLEGVPCALKDNILVKGICCTAGSKILENYIAPYNSTVTEKLNNEGYVLLGKTNMDEFAMGSSTENSYFGPTKNPIDETCVPGGSSGGSASCVADNQVIYALGSDTGGSIRQPSALTGCVGLKPTYGRVSRYGLISMASSFDQIGPITKTVKDCAIVFDAIYGQDNNDTTTVLLKNQKPFYEFEPNIKGKKIGFPKDILIDGMDNEIKNAIIKTAQDLQKQGAEIIDVKLPYLKYALSAYYLIVPAEISSNLARFDGIRFGNSPSVFGGVDDGAKGGVNQKGESIEDIYQKTRGECFGKEVQRRIILGTYVLSAGYCDEYYKKAQKLRELIINDYNRVFENVDCLLTPTTPNVAFKLGSLISDPLTMYLEDIYTVAINVAGIPAISVPCGVSLSGLPIGAQLVAKHFNENILFEVGSCIDSF